LSRFHKADKKKSHVRLAIFGPSGSGKTYTSLAIASGLGDTIGLIDSERRRSVKKAHFFTFSVLELENKSIDSYCSAIVEAAEEGFDVLIIDSMTHAWKELLHEIDQMARSKFKGNTWAAWSEGTPKQEKFIDTILNFPGHVIVTMRSKTVWDVQNDNGKVKPIRIGTSPEQRDGVEYEFDLLVDLNIDHVAHVIKDDTGRYQDRIIEKPGKAFGEELRDWLSEGSVDEEQEALYSRFEEYRRVYETLQPYMSDGDRMKHQKFLLAYHEGKVKMANCDNAITYYTSTYGKYLQTPSNN
jgi:hypothetical protein